MDPANVQRYRVHHSYIWLGGAKVGIIVLMAVVVSNLSALPELLPLLMGASGAGSRAAVGGMTVLLLMGLFALIGVVLLFGLSFGGRAWGWKHLWYELGPSEFSLYSGIFNKKRVHVPYSRVQSIDQRASLIQRLMGVCMVSIDTAGGASNKAIVVPYVTRGQAEQLRAQLFARKQLALIEARSDVNPTVLAAARAAIFQADQGVAAAQAGAGMPGVAPGAVPTAGGAPYAGGVAGATPTAMPGAVPGAIMPQAASTPGAVPGVVLGAAAAAMPTANLDAGNLLDLPDDLMQEVGDLFGGAVYQTGTVTYEYGLTNKELILTGLSNGTALVVLLFTLIAALAQGSSVLLEWIPGLDTAVASAATSVVSGPSWFSVLGIMAVGLIGIGLVLWLLSALGTCVSYGGFRARRRDDRIEVERGLLSRQFQGVSVDRVQSVVIKQSFIRRVMGYCELTLGKIDAASDSNDTDSAKLAQGGLVIHPFVKVNRVPAILEGLIPEFADLPQDSVAVAPVALRRAIIRRCLWQGGGFWLAICVALFQLLCLAFAASGDRELQELAAMALPFCFMGYGLALVLLIIDLIGAILWARESSFGCNRRFMQVRNGGLSRESTAFPRNKIQFGYLRTNPLQALAHTTTLTAVTAAGVGSTSVRLIDVPVQAGEDWLAWLEPRVSSQQEPSNEAPVGGVAEDLS